MKFKRVRGRVSKAGRLGGFALALMLAGCDGSPEPALSDEDRRTGAEQHLKLLAEFGGAYQGDEAAYVQSVGRKMASAAGLSNACTFTLVNSDVVNAFAVPGCYIYVTRGLLGIVNSEAELASVLGHELGHILHNHSRQQEKRSALRSLGVLAVSVISGSERLTQLAGSAAGFFDLRYSRKHEYEADDLALTFLRTAGYDPLASADMLQQLQRHSSFQARARGRNEAERMPEWALTHPLTQNRIQRASSAGRAIGVAPNSLPEHEGAYLRAVDGLLYGDDPEQGFVIGRRFAHSLMRITFEAPPGFSLTNTPRAILIDGPDGLRGAFGGGTPPSKDLGAHAEALLRETVGDAPTEVLSAGQAQGSGLPAYLIRANVVTRSGAVPISVLALGGAGRQAYHFVLFSSPGSTHGDAIMALARSFRLLSASEAAALRPRHIRVVPVRPGQSAQGLAARMAGDRPIEHFLMINGRHAAEALRPGEYVKIVQ